NVDYNDLKYLIKAHTTRGQGRAVTIPTQKNAAKALEAFEDEFFSELRNQHQRVDLFVQSKTGEVTRRLIHLEKQISQLKLHASSLEPTRLSIKRLERLSGLEQATLKVGEDIQSLTRFVKVQKTAFQKLLKKYRRWTGSSNLAARFEAEVLKRPGSLSTKDFGFLLSQWNGVLAAMRALFNRETNSQGVTGGSYSRGEKFRRKSALIDKSPQATDQLSPETPLRRPFSSAKKLHSICQEGSEPELDTALAVVPIGKRGGKATYWVHPENLIELHVLLLKYTRRRITSPTSSVSSPAPQNNAGGAESPSKERASEIAGAVICDDLQSFSRRQSSAPLGDSEDQLGSGIQKAAACIRYSPDGEAVIAIDSSGEAKTAKKKCHFRQSRLKSKAVHRLFDIEQPVPSPEHFSQKAENEDAWDTLTVRKWLIHHPKIHPLVQVFYKRTRFFGLGNNETKGVWATLDTDIEMAKCSSSSFSLGETFPGFVAKAATNSRSFPFSVLEVRFEGTDEPDLVTVLDGTHLLPALDQDIRKIPSLATYTSLNLDNKPSMYPGSAEPTSTSATSAGDRPTSSGFSIPTAKSSATSEQDQLGSPPPKKSKKRRRPRRERSLRRQTGKVMWQQPQQHRYWNEFDDGDEVLEFEPYTIYVDPPKPSHFPGIETLSKTLSSVASGVKIVEQRVRPWMTSSSVTDGERQRLIDEVSIEDDSDLENFSPTEPPVLRGHRHYNTFHDSIQGSHWKDSERVLFRSCIASLTASFILVIIAFVVASNVHRQTAVIVDLGIIIGVVWSLVFALIGAICMIKLANRLGWAHRMTVMTAVSLISVISGLVLTGIVDG
ncbi:MAG: hypothetical protein Q9214_005683, partial [Letrouitia sp. 1 TL-2023]